MYERFTDRARTVGRFANLEAERRGKPAVAPEDWLLGMVREGDGVAAQILKNRGIQLSDIRREVDRLTGFDDSPQS